MVSSSRHNHQSTSYHESGPDQEWRTLMGDLEIVHHIPGRIRVRVSGGLLSKTMAGQMQRWLEKVRNLSGVISVGVNVMARSGTITYDPAVIAPRTWSDVLSDRDTEEAAMLIRRLVLDQNGRQADGPEARR